MISNWIDTSKWQMLGLKVEPKIANRETGEVAQTKDGRRKHVVSVFVTDTLSGDSELVSVSVAGTDAPEVVPGQPVEFAGLRATFWEFDAADGRKRAGLSFVADGVRSVAGVRKAAA